MRPDELTILERIQLFREAGAIKRSHTVRTLMERSVAEHSHGVIMILLEIYRAHGHELPSAGLLAAAACHDLSEIETGDIPAPSKWKHNALRIAAHDASSQWEADHDMHFTLMNEEMVLLAWADAVDFALFGLEEVTMGNRFMHIPLGRIYRRIRSKPLPSLRGNSEKVHFFTQAVLGQIEGQLSPITLKEERLV